MCVKVSSANKVIHNDLHYMHINMRVHTLQAQNTHTLWLTLINTHVNMHKCPHATQWIKPHAWLNQASLGTLLLSYCQILFKYIAKLHLNPEAITLQLSEKDLLLFFPSECSIISMLSELGLILSSSIPWCLCSWGTHLSGLTKVFVYMSRRMATHHPSCLFSGLMRNIPGVMALAASKMGNPYLLWGSSAGYGEKSFCAGREGYACVTSQRAKFCIIFHRLFVFVALWDDMNGSIFTRGSKLLSGWCWWVHADGAIWQKKTTVFWNSPFWTVRHITCVRHTSRNCLIRLLLCFLHSTYGAPYKSQEL